MHAWLATLPCTIYECAHADLHAYCRKLGQSINSDDILVTLLKPAIYK